MSYPDIQPAEKSDVTATLHFLSRNKLYEVEKPYNHHYNLPDSVDIPRSNIFSEAVDNILIRNIRHCDLNFVNNGIEFVNLQSRMTYDDFWDPTKIEAIFVPEIEELVQSKLGAQEVHVYEYAVSGAL
jgi:hypothetical protein